MKTALQTHIEQLELNPMPRPYKPDSKEGVAWRNWYQWFVTEKERLECRERLGLITSPGVAPSFANRIMLDNEPKKVETRPCMSGCGRPRLSSKKARCLECQAKIDREQYAAKNSAKKLRRQRIREAVLEVQRERMAS